MSIRAWLQATFNIVRPTLVDTDTGPIACDSDSVLLTRNAGGSPGSGPITTLPQTGDVATPTVVKASPGDFLQVAAINAGAADGGTSTITLYLQIFDRTAALAGGETPLWISPPIPVGETVAWAWGEGLPHAIGIMIAPSSTRLIYTASGAGENLNSAGRYR